MASSTTDPLRRPIIWPPSFASLIGVTLAIVAPLVPLNDASAHPFGAKYAAHRVDLHIGDEAIELHYIAEVPNGILKASRADDPLDEMKMELLSGLVLQVDGEPIALRVAGPAEIQENDDAYQIGLRMRAELPGPISEIVLSDGNLPDVPGVFSATATVDDGIRVLESSLLRLKEGVVHRDDSERWHMGPGHRETTLHIAQPWLAWTWIGPSLSPEPIGVAAAYPPTWTELLRQPLVTPSVGALAVLFGFLAGLVGERPKWPIALGCSIPAIPCALWLPSPTAEITATIVAIAAIVAARRNIGAGTLLVGGIAVATHAVGLAILVFASYLGGAALVHRLNRPDHVVLLASLAAMFAGLMVLRITGP